MLAALGSILMVVTTVIPLAYTVAKYFPLIGRFFRYIFMGTRGMSIFGVNPVLGVLLGVFTFVGGAGFFASIYFGWGFELYLKFFDFVFTPFSMVAKTLIESFIHQLPNLPANTASVLCLFDFGSVFTFLLMGFSFEVYLRVVIVYLLRLK